MDEKANKGKMRRMNKEEFAYNKHLLKEINDKRKASNYESQSRGDYQEGDQIWKGKTSMAPLASNSIRQTILWG